MNLARTLRESCNPARFAGFCGSLCGIIFVMTALIIEDDGEERDFLHKGLSEMGYSCTLCRDGNDGLAKILEKGYDLAIVDLMLPGKDGRDIIRLSREAGVVTPIIVVSNLGSVNDRIAGLNLGADAYLPKPCAMSELKAHITAFDRRFRNAKDRVLVAGGIRLDTCSRTCLRDDRSVGLSRIEFGLLECLMRNRGTVVTRGMLLSEVWGYDCDYATDVITPHMSRLRGKLSVGSEKDPIESRRQQGYVFHA